MVSESVVHAYAGGAGGLVSMAATYPLMAISTRAAVDRSARPGESMLHAARKVLAEEGIRGLYDGLGSSLLGVGVSNFVYYFFFEAAREFIITSRRVTHSATASMGTLSTIESIVAGLISGTATAIVSNPIWVVNTRQATGMSRQVRAAKSASTNGANAGGAAAPGAAEPGAAPGAAPSKAELQRLGFIETLQDVVKKDGVLALWRGLGPALVLVTNPVLQYTVFEQIKNHVLQARQLRRAHTASAKPLLTDIDFFWLGAVSKLVATVITYPQIVIKSRRQALSNERNEKRANLWTAMTEIVEQEGFAGLYRGLGSKLLQSILTAAILFASKERIYVLTKSLLEASTRMAAVA